MVDPPALADIQDPVTVESWIYDRDHNILTFTDQNGSIHTYTYDGLNRKTQCDITFAASNPHNLTGTTLQTHEYDGLSRKTRCTDNNQPGDPEDDILCTYGYDTLSRKIEEACQIGSNPVRITSYHFDESLGRAGNLDPISMIYPDGREVEYHYDGINRLNQINDASHSSIVAYDYIGRTPRVLQKSHQNGTLTTMEYDGIRRPTQLLTAFSQQPIIGFEHDYDKEDNKLNERKLHDSINSELYAYDSAYRLTTFDRGTLNTGGTAITTPTITAGVLQLRDWTLDGVGNWSTNSSQNVGADLLVANRQHTNFNEITEENVGGASSPRLFDNDFNGNLLTDDTFDIQWDALNRLRTVTRISDDLQVAAYTYSYDNKRMAKTLQPTASTPASTTHYYYSGWRVCEEYDFDGTNETLKYQYVWGATYHDELITRDNRTTATTVAQLNDGTGSDRQFQHHNALFSIFAVTDEAGAVLERYQYDPYGNITIFSATFDLRPSTQIFQEFTYTGQRFDIETGLYYYKNRYYSSDQGRFISRDPIGYDSGSLGLYEYAQSKPIDFADPFGLIIPGDPDPTDEIIIAMLLKKGFKALIKYLSKKKLNKIAKCKAIHTAYTKAKKEAKGCVPGLSHSKYKKLVAARAAEVTGRAAYLKFKCDYVLPGSIKAGSKKKEINHKIELGSKTKALANCTALMNACPSP